jgi:hypothetical protein
MVGGAMQEEAVRELVRAAKAALKFQVANAGTKDEFYSCYTMGKEMPKWVTDIRAALRRVEDTQ